jgi:hypothetical protein
MTRYIGRRHPETGTTFVSVLDEQTRCVSALDPGFRFVNHSPNGFDWGYTGSGPAQLAFALLLDHCGALGPALLFYQDFKEREIATLNTDRWEMTSGEVEAALVRIREFRSQSRREKACPDST